MSELLGSLNAAQREAVVNTEGPILVLAGPGSGKTRVLTYRVAYLIQEGGVPPWRIMAVTFTNKAANEMKERLQALLGDADLSNLTIGTFHAICVRILRREADALGIDRNFVIYDDGDQRSLVRQAIRELNLDDKLYRPRAMQNLISRAKTEMLGPKEFEPRNYREEVARRIYARYQQLLIENNAFDFDDLLLRVVVAFREQPELLQKYQRRYQYVLVDEFQDTNAVQYELVRQLSGGYHNLFAVGDEDQSIYMFRGANFYNVLKFERDYPDTKKVLLERNYRSTQTILDVANATIAPNTQRTPKKLYTERHQGPLALTHEAFDENQEGRWVVQTIQDLIREGVSPGECAVMYRTNAQSRALEDAFLAESMPYKLVGATRFYARREIKDLMAYMRIIHNPYDTVSLTRILNVPARQIGSKTLASLVDWAARRGLTLYDALHDLSQEEDAPIYASGRRALLGFYGKWAEWIALRDQVSVLELLDDVIEGTGYGAYLRDGSQEGEDRWENVLELRSVASEYSHLPLDEALLTFLEEISLVSDVDNLDETEAPTLLTLHSAKGLEFETVFIVGLNDGLLPHSRCFDDPDQMEEERRLFYVGVTRAKNRLYLSHTFRRTIFGSSELGAPSRFLGDIPPQLKMSAAQSPPQQNGMRFGRTRREAGARQRAASAVAAAPLRTGDAVRHPTFGEGTVIEVKQRGADWDVTVAFKRLGIKTLAASFANLEKVG